MNLNSILRHACAVHSGHPAVSDRGRSFTYREIAERASRVAAAIVACGAGSGGRVAALLPNCAEFLELYFAAPLAGSILVPLNSRLNAIELAGLIDHSGAAVLFAHRSLAGLAAEAAAASKSSPVVAGIGFEPGGPGSFEYETAAGASSPFEAAPFGDPSEADPAQIYYTSGTTGRPKGVVLTHGNVCSHAMMAMAETGLCDRDSWLHAAPMFHLADAWAAFAVTWAGGSHAFCPSFDPAAVLPVMRGQGITLTNLVPAMLRSLVSHPDSAGGGFETLRLILSGGAPISPELVRKIESVFSCEYRQTYGLTETSPYLTISTAARSLDGLAEEEKFWYRASTGRPLAGVEVRVVGEGGRDVPADRKTVGEIVCRGPTVTPGYWKDPDATSAAFRDGWFRTGDLAVMDGRGYLNIVDRARDVIVTGGEKVYSVEVENALLSHPCVSEAAVFAVPDEKWGEAVRAQVALKGGSHVTGAELIAHCKSLIAHFKAPKSVDFADSLPKTGSGKICKREIREKYWSGLSRRVN